MKRIVAFGIFGVLLFLGALVCFLTLGSQEAMKERRTVALTAENVAQCMGLNFYNLNIYKAKAGDSIGISFKPVGDSEALPLLPINIPFTTEMIKQYCAKIVFDDLDNSYTKVFLVFPDEKSYYGGKIKSPFAQNSSHEKNLVIKPVSDMDNLFQFNDTVATIYWDNSPKDAYELSFEIIPDSKTNN